MWTSIFNPALHTQKFITKTPGAFRSGTNECKKFRASARQMQLVVFAGKRTRRRLRRRAACGINFQLHGEQVSEWVLGGWVGDCFERSDSVRTKLFTKIGSKNCRWQWKLYYCVIKLLMKWILFCLYIMFCFCYWADVESFIMYFFSLTFKPSLFSSE